jgi:hypothetical protein
MRGAVGGFVIGVLVLGAGGQAAAEPHKPAAAAAAGT